MTHDPAGFRSLAGEAVRLLGPLERMPHAEALLAGYAAGRAEPKRRESIDGLTCARCRDAGWQRRDLLPGETGFGELVPCSCSAGSAVTERRQARVWQQAGIPPKYAALGLDSLARCPGKATLAEQLRAWQQTRSWLLLWGPPGTCKSGAAAALLAAHQQRGGQGLFALLGRMLDRLQATFDGRSDEPGYEQAFATLVDAELLVLDDIGANRRPLSSWGAEQLFKIVDARDLAERTTILTTNLPAGGGQTVFGEYVGAPAWSRIRGRCGRWIVETSGPDLRGLDRESEAADRGGVVRGEDAATPPPEVADAGVGDDE